MLLRIHILLPHKQLLSVRLMHSAIYLTFTHFPHYLAMPELHGTCFERLVTIKCLTKAEAEILSSLRRFHAADECLLWLLRELRDEMDGGALRPPIYRAIEAQIDKLRLKFEMIEAYIVQPIPFLYYHLVCLLSEV